MKNLTINLAKDEYGKDLIIDLSRVKHLLIAGSTGSGKSVLLHNILSTLITNNSRECLRLILIDPKRVEMSVYAKIPYMLTPVIIDIKKAILAIRWATTEMIRRYEALEKNGVKDIGSRDLPETMPHVVIVIDEFSDLMDVYPRETESAVLKIAQMGHVVGIHIIIATSRLGTKIFTSSIRDAIGARIAMQTASVQDSKLIIGTSDACMLRGSGDLLFRDGLKYIVRGQGRLVSDEDIKTQCKSLYKDYGDGSTSGIGLEASASDAFDMMIDDSDADELYEEARKEVIAPRGKASTSYIQRRLGIGYSHAAKLIDMLEKRGVIGPANGSKLREVIQKE